MRGSRFYTVPFDARNDPKISMLRHRSGGIVAYGRWQALLGILYDQDALIDLADEGQRWLIAKELELQGKDRCGKSRLDGFMDALADVNLIDKKAWVENQKVFSEGVFDQLDYKSKQSIRAATSRSSKSHPNDGNEGNEEAK